MPLPLVAFRENTLMIHARIQQAVALLLAVLCLLFTHLETHAAAIKEIRIADSSGDWGFPTPYRHYPRGPGYIRMSMIFDTLIWRDHTGRIPALATAWEYNPESLRYTFTLREGVQWHDGKPFTPADVLFTVQYFQKHPYSWIRFENLVTCEITGPHQVSFTLKEPYAPFLAMMETMPILPEHIWSSVEDPKTYDAPESLIGTGPYRLLDFDRAKGTYLYEAFPEYYLGQPRVERLIYIKADDPLIALLSGKADLAGIQANMVDTLTRRGMEMIQDQRGWNKKLLFNHRKAPYNTKEFRQALVYAIDRQEIIDKGHQGFGSPGSPGMLSPDHEFYTPEAYQYAYDLSKTESLLKGLGYTKGSDGFFAKEGKRLTVHLLASTLLVADRDGEIIKQQLERAGIAVDLQNQEKTSADSRIQAWDFELVLSGHGGLLGDAVVLNRTIEPDGGSITSARYDGNAELLRLLQEQIREPELEKRRALVHEIQRIYAEEIPALPLYYPQSMSAYNPAKGVRWQYTPGGVANGIPSNQNKIYLVR